MFLRGLRTSLACSVVSVLCSGSSSILQKTNGKIQLNSNLFMPVTSCEKMCETLLNSICRLCLKDNYSLSCIYTYITTSGETVFKVLEKIYDLKICEGDGLPSQVCAACLWKMLEFDMYRRNVKYAEMEFRKLISRTKSKEVSDEQTDNATESTAEREMNVASDPVGGINSDSEVPIKNEIEIEEWEMPQDILPQENIKNEALEDVVKETEVSNNTAIEIEVEEEEEIRPEKDTIKVSTDNDFECSYSANDGQTEELQSTESCNINSSDCLGQMDVNCENLPSENSSSVVSTSEISGKNKGKCEESVKTGLFSDKESFFSLKSKSGINSAKSGSSSSGMTVRSKKKFVCDICKKSFDKKQKIRHHVRVHYDDRPYKCLECGKSFKQETTKIAHELTHLKKQKKNKGDKKRSTGKCYVCKICKKELSTRQNLQTHSNLHKNKYLCSICRRRCGSKIELNRHLRIHTNEKPFSCEVCKKTFNQKVTLNRHLAIHSDDYHFQCNVCDKRFKTKNNKNRHELVHLRRK